ncbi:MAG: hypothetical protein HZB43_05815 [candidate division Zixibacteria bacterium]|nr:hypothetical protein [candidate division Zixibacteria bacterium]
MNASALFLIAALALLVSANPVHAAVIKSVQRGTATFTSGANTLPVTLTTVDATKTIVWGGIQWGGGRNSSANANSTRFGYQLASGTTLNLQRLGSPAITTAANWEAVEFLSGVSVQRGTAAFSTAATTVNVTITSANLAESFVLVSVAANSASGTIDEQWTVRAQLTTSTNLALTRNESGIALDVYWQVVSYTGASVQRGLTTIASGASSATATITSVNLAKSFLVMSGRGAAATNGIEAQYSVRGRITTATQLTFDRISTTNTADVAWEVVTLTDASTVQSGTIAVGSTLTTGSATLTPVVIANTATLINVRGGSGTSTSRLDEIAFTHNLTSTTALGVTRDGTGSAADVAWFAIQFPGGQAPVLDSIRAQAVAEGANLTFRTHATDADGTTPTFTVVGAPLNSTFVDSLNGAGSFVFNPDYTQAGVINVTFIASDGTLADSEVVAITVTNTNRVPVLDSIRAQSVAEGANLTFRTHATDPDGTNPTFTVVGAPPNSVFVDSLNGAGSFVFNPDFTQSGVINVTFITSDGSLADSEVVAITVTNVNLPPVLDSIRAKTVAENANLTFRTHASDPDGTTPTLTAVGAPPNAVFVDSLNGAGSLVFNPDFTQSGVINVTFIASDGILADSEVVAITVTNTDRPPVRSRRHSPDPDGSRCPSECDVCRLAERRGFAGVQSGLQPVGRD